MYDIITIGSATRDVFLLSPYFKISHGKECFVSGSKVEVKEIVFSTGGGSTNSAATFSRQGLKTAALLRLGNDESAGYILDAMRKEKISPLIIKDKNIDSDYSTIIIDPSGERTVLVYRGSSSGLKISEVPFEKMRSRWVYIAPGDMSLQVMSGIFNHFYKNKTNIAFSPSEKFIKLGVKKLKPLLDKANVLILNAEEAAEFTGIKNKNEKEIFGKLDKAVRGIVAMTKGSKGAVVSDGKNIYRAGIFKTKLIDRTGAGDAFGSGFVTGLIKQIQNSEFRIQNLSPKAIEYAIRLGTANAASVVEKIGAKEGVLTEKEFEKEKRWKKLKIN